MRIFLPLSKPPFVVMGITAFLAYWNSYVWPIMTITSPEKFVLIWKQAGTVISTIDVPSKDDMQTQNGAKLIR